MPVWETPGWGGDCIGCMRYRQRRQRRGQRPHLPGHLRVAILDIIIAGLCLR